LLQCKLLVAQGGEKMKKVIFVLLLHLFLTLFLIGCESNNSSKIQENYIGNPTADEVLTENPNANIFMFSDIIYNAGVPWVDELQLIKDQYITEITKQTDIGRDFVNGTANKLNVGTKIYSVKERGNILIAETENGDIRFYNLVEG
jgi:hypothetical protein